jgi:hypothetical protein
MLCFQDVASARVVGGKNTNNGGKHQQRRECYAFKTLLPHEFLVEKTPTTARKND